MSSHAKRILILSSNTGGGHQSAAGALQESILRLSPGKILVGISHVLEEASFLSRHMADLYNYLLRYHQHYMRYYYWTIERLRPYENNMVFQASLKYGKRVFKRYAPTTLVSVHPMTQHFFAYILKKLRLIDKIPLVTVVTDPCAGFWKGWACPEVSQYFVASDEAKDQLIEYGVPDAHIQITGMPIHSRFQPLTTADEKQLLRQNLNLDPDRFTILVNSGWAGGGNVPEIYESLVKAAARNIQVVFIAGHNDALREQAEKMALSASVPVKVLGFTNTIDAWMNASDVMVSKLGGLSTFEAMACQLPVFADCLTPPMPQEEGTARFIEKHGAGALITDPAQVLHELDMLLLSPDRYRDMKAAATRLGRPGAVDIIASEILKYAH